MECPPKERQTLEDGVSKEHALQQERGHGSMSCSTLPFRPRGVVRREQEAKLAKQVHFSRISYLSD